MNADVFFGIGPTLLGVRFDNSALLIGATRQPYQSSGNSMTAAYGCLMADLQRNNEALIEE
jgi:hypothetical protein